MKKKTFNELVGDAKMKLYNGAIYGYGETINATVECDKIARALKDEVEEIIVTYLEDVPESFESMESLDCYISELNTVTFRLSKKVLKFREWGRSYGLTEYAKAVLHDVDDSIHDLVFERSAAERAYDIVYELIKNEEKRDQELEAAHVNDEDELMLAMYNLVRDHGYDRLRYLVGLVADHTGNVMMGEDETITTTKADTRTEPEIRYESTGPFCAPCNPECCATKTCPSNSTCDLAKLRGKI